MKTNTDNKRIRMLSEWIKGGQPKGRKFAKRVSVKLGRRWKASVEQ